MQRISGAGHFNNTFVAEDVNIGQQPTQITADWMNAVQEELVNVVLGANLPLDVNNNGQVLEALNKLIIIGTQIIDVPIANTQVLPSASSFAAGKRISFLNVGAGISTISITGTDVIRVNATTTNAITMGTGDTLTLESNGVNSWYAVNGSAQLKYSGAFKYLNAANGYTYLGNGLLMQFGVGSASVAGVFNTFPIAFPSGNAPISYAVIPAGSGTLIANGGATATAAGFTIHSNASCSVRYIVIGN